MAAEAYRGVSPDALVPDERDARTGRRIPGRDSKDRSRRPRAPKRTMLVAAGVAGAVLVAGTVAAVVVTGDGGAGDDTVVAGGTNGRPAGDDGTPGDGQGPTPGSAADLTGEYRYTLTLRSGSCESTSYAAPVLVTGDDGDDRTVELFMEAGFKGPLADDHSFDLTSPAIGGARITGSFDVSGDAPRFSARETTQDPACSWDVTGVKSTTPRQRSVGVSYSAGEVVESLNTGALPPEVNLSCSADGCTLGNPTDDAGPQPADGGRWTVREVDDMGPVCIPGDTGVPRGRQVFEYTWDLTGVGVTEIDGIEVPARITGTYTMNMEGVPDCLDPARFVFRYDAPPDR